jgi:hypothetical protein
MSTRPRVAACLAVCLVTACSEGSAPPKVPLGQRAQAPMTAAPAAGMATAAPMPPAPPINPDARPPLDSGNALFRRKAYSAALAQYRLAAQRAPEHAAPLFGIYMAAQAMNNPRLADSALAGIKALEGAAAAGSPHRVK